MANNKQIAQNIVDRMLALIGNGQPLPWVKPWSMTRPSVKVIDGQTTISIPVTHWSRQGRPYNGINPDLLRIDGKQGEMITFAQCKAEGGHIRKGAKASTIIYWTQVIKEEEQTYTDDDGTEKTRIVKTRIPILKTFNVFSVEKDTDLEPKHHPEPRVLTFEQCHWEPVDGLDTDRYDTGAESVIAGYLDRNKTLALKRDGTSDSAYYCPGTDEVVVPCINQYDTVSEFYSTLFHELGHSTGHASRLNRFTGKDANAAFGSESYSREELVAEITAASILSTLGLDDGNSFRNSAAYVKSWSEHIKADPMMYITAAGRAEKAIDCILTGTI